MAEPIARTIVREVLDELQAFGIDVRRLEPETHRAIRERLVHVVDARVKDGVLRLLEHPSE